MGSLNVKAFRKPNFINTIVYRYFRDSKAKRSYNFGLRLLQKNIGTPTPIAYAEYTSGIRLGKSFYVCEHIYAEFTYRDLVQNSGLKDHEEILRAFTQFCFNLHENGVEFKDHSPGNTLIKKVNEGYAFYLVDLNRMNFHLSLSFNQRMYNLRRLTPKKDMIAVMANEYAKFYTQKTENEIFNLMWQYTSEFQENFIKNNDLKKELNFGKNSGYLFCNRLISL